LPSSGLKIDEESVFALFGPHKPNIIDALGKDWFDVNEGEA
jgi:hypothetical protein